MSASLFSALALVLAPASGGPTITSFTDGTFDDADWEMEDIDAGGVAIGTAGQVSIGNPQPARRVTHEFVSGPGLYSIWTRHVMTTAVHDPAVDGALETLVYSIDTDNIESLHRLGWALRQGERFFLASGPLTTSGWETHTSAVLTAEDFVERLSDGSTDGSSHPDFSAAGDPIAFGFEASNGSNTGTVRTVDYDNFQVDVNGIQARVDVRAGTPANPDALRPGAGGPVIGTSWQPFIDHKSFLPGATTDFVIYSSQPGNVLTNYGSFLCAEIEIGMMLPAGQVFDFAVPDNVLLAGQTYCFQGASCDPALGVFLTNALDVTIGHF